jgi:hypothetical protein
MYQSYKHFPSIVLLALVDANYKFLYIDVGANGRMSDADIFSRSELCRLIDERQLNVPRDLCLPGMPPADSRVPHIILADEGLIFCNCAP